MTQNVFTYNIINGVLCDCVSVDRYNITTYDNIPILRYAAGRTMICVLSFPFQRGSVVSARIICTLILFCFFFFLSVATPFFRT